MSTIISMNNVAAMYGKEFALQDVNFEVQDNDFIGVIGPNGGGKTTLIRLMTGLLKPASGSIVFPDTENATHIGYLPQQSFIDNRFPISVLEIVLSGLMSLHKGFRRYSHADKELAKHILDKMGISHLAQRTVKQLSGGQLQRVLIGRALISSPRMLILDEPGTYVDNRFESDLYQLLLELNKSMAIIIVSHDVGTISYYVKTIACVNKTLHYHRSNIITEEQLADYNCPLQIITHGDVPHTVLQKHEHTHDHEHTHTHE